jgi:hypothetical protein
MTRFVLNVLMAGIIIMTCVALGIILARSITDRIYGHCEQHTMVYDDGSWKRVIVCER